MPICHLTTSLLGSLDPDAQAAKATEVFGLPKDQEPTEEQLGQVEGTLMAAALKPFHDPKLRDLLLNLKRSHEQVIDEITQDELLQAGYDAQARRGPGARSRTSKSSSSNTRTNLRPSRSSTAGRTGQGCDSGRSKTSPPP